MNGVRTPGDSVLGMGLPEPANESTGHSVQVGFQMDHGQVFNISLSHRIFGIDLYFIQNFNLNNLKFKLTGHPVVYLATLARKLWTHLLLSPQHDPHLLEGEPKPRWTSWVLPYL